MSTAKSLHVPVSVGVENKFYCVVRWFGLLLASLSFAATLYAIAHGFSMMNAKPDYTIHTPSVSYSDFQKNLEASIARREKTEKDDTLQRSEQVAQEAQKNVDFERKLKPLLENIVGNLTKYATEMQMPLPSEQGVGDFVRDNMHDISRLTDENMAWSYANSVKEAAADLAGDAGRLSKLPADDKRRLLWHQFLGGHASEFISQLKEQFDRTRREEDRVLMEKAGAMNMFYAAGATFMLFVMATILLVLLRIERNTRPIGAIEYRLGNGN